MGPVRPSFKLGGKYTAAFDVHVLGEDSKAMYPIMGSYGIGVERAMAAIVETNHDDRGIVWPVAVAPFEVAVVPIGKGDEQARSTADEIYDQLGHRGVDVIIDDRDERPGVKFGDVELVGIPYRVTVGSRGLAKGSVEVTTRATGETVDIPAADAVDYVRQLVSSTKPPGGSLVG